MMGNVIAGMSNPVVFAAAVTGETEREIRFDDRSKHGSVIVLVARMLPTFRSLISIPAGIFKMSHRRFLVFSAIGTAGWSAALAGAGYVLGTQFGDVEKILGPLSTAIFALIVVGYFWRLWRWNPER